MAAMFLVEGQGTLAMALVGTPGLLLLGLGAGALLTRPGRAAKP
jgi:hypothetical protein